MKQTLLILALITSTIQTFAQSPRIKLNQITKDTVKGSVLISSASDSGMVYSRDFYIAYGADTVLILYGDTLGGVGGGFASVLSDGVTITGDGTTGNELKVDTATVISTIQGLVDTLTARGYLTANETITLSGDVTGSGNTAITATVVDDSHNHIISNVDFLQDSLDAKANDSDLTNYVTIAGTETITGAKTFTTSLTVNERIFVNAGNGNQLYLNNNGEQYTQITFANNSSPTKGALYYDNSNSLFEMYAASGNGLAFHSSASERMRINSTGNVGIGTTGPSYKLDVNGNVRADTYYYDVTSTLQSSSDSRLKQNITDMDNVLDKLKELELVKYEWNDNMYKKLEGRTSQSKLGGTFEGMIAQQVESLFPQYVGEDADGYKTLSYVSFVIPLLKGFQEQQAIIESQATEIETLKTLITDLSNRLQILENN